MISHAISFSESVKEALKASTDWSAHYFTSRERWYPLPDNSLPFSLVKFPKRVPNGRYMNPEKKREMREWASINGAVVRQRSGQQETTMARAGTMPENAYFEEMTPIVNDQQMHEEEKQGEEEKEAEEIIKEILTYSSDDGNISSSENDEDVEENASQTVSEIGNETTFLVGRSSRYGRSITINKRFVQ